MVAKALTYSHCGSTDLAKHGFAPNGKQKNTSATPAAGRVGRILALISDKCESKRQHASEPYASPAPPHLARFSAITLTAPSCSGVRGDDFVLRRTPHPLESRPVKRPPPITLHLTHCLEALKNHARSAQEVLVICSDDVGSCLHHRSSRWVGPGTVRRRRPPTVRSPARMAER